MENFHIDDTSSHIFHPGMNGVRGTTVQPSAGSIYSVTHRGEVLVFDPSAAVDSGQDENSVVGSSYSQVLTQSYIGTYILLYVCK